LLRLMCYIFIMKMLYIINGLGFSNNIGIGGSDKRAVEIIRNVKRDHPKNDYDILTTESGRGLFIGSEKIDTKYFTIKQPSWWPDKLKGVLIGRIISYIYAFTASILWVNKFKAYDLYFATSDFFFDVIPGYFYKKRHKKKLVCMIHHYIADPLSREGPVFINLMMYLSQQISFWLILNTADAVFFYDTEEGRKIVKMLFKDKKKKVPVYYVKNGINDTQIDQVGPQPKKYEACFLGGIRHSKGIKEFVPAWKIIVNKFPKAKLLVIGGGIEEIVSMLTKEIKKVGLEDNIILTGPLSSHELFSGMKQSKLFFFPSHEEGWGIALCEAMYCGLPIICYKLPAFKTFGDVLDKYEVGDYKALAGKVIEYLERPELIKQKEHKLISTAKKYTWNSIAKEDHQMYEEILKSSS